MASFKLNIALIDNCPDAEKLGQAIESYGVPDNEEFGVLGCTATDSVVYAQILRRTSQAIQKFDPETSDVATTAVEKAVIIPCGIFPEKGVIETYEGSSTGLDHIANFFASSLALPTVVTQIPVDIPAAIEKLKANTPGFQLKSVRVSEYAANSYMSGAYSPKFFESEHGCEFTKEYVDYVMQASVKFQGPHGKVAVTLTPKACFRYSIANEEDKNIVQAALRKLL